MITKKVDVTFYRMQCNNFIASLFTQNARERIYFNDEYYYISNGVKNFKNSLYYILDGKKVFVPFNYESELFSKCVLALYPIGAVISDKNNANSYGEVVYYNMENNMYVIKNGNGSHLKIHFDNAIVRDMYYFISSSGKVQRDIVGRDKMVDNFRMRTNNYFETKEEANKKLLEINLETSK